MKNITPSTAQLRMLASIKSQQWLIREDCVQDFALSALEAAEKSDAQERGDSYWSQFYTLRKAAYIDQNGIAHIEIRGALLEKAPPLYEMLGLVTRYSTIIDETTAAKAQGARGVIHYYDTPGGTVSGVIEGGAAIADLGLPVVAFCSGLTCSAGYWLCSGSTVIIATPSATMGNIGAIISWADCDEFWKELGITFKALVSDGADLKSTFHLEPDEAQLEFLQESINEAGASFRDHVTQGRAAAGVTLDEEVFRAGWYSGERAGKLGLIDAIGTREDAVSVMLSILD